MKLVIDISKDRYDEIMAMDWKNCRRFFDEEIRAIHDGKALAQEPCEDEYIKVPKKALKYRTAGMVAYNAEWLKNHFDIERTAICGAQEPCDAVSRDAAVNACLNGWNKDYKEIVADIKALPSVTPAEKVGRWVFVKGYEGLLYECTVCKNKNTHTTVRWNYCPHCGAKMQEVEG